jgi:hypothetical protein
MNLSEDKYYEKTIKILLELKEAYPNYLLGKHLYNALADRTSSYMWSKTDRQIFNSINTYKERLMSKIPYVEESQIEKIIKEGMNLDTILDDEDND